MTGPDVQGHVVIELEFGILVYPPRPDREQAGRKRRPTRWLLIETAARIRACEQRQVPPHDHDLAEKDSLLLAIGNACVLASSDVLRHLEPQVAARTDVITQPWHPVHVTSATELAALDFPQPVQASGPARTCPKAPTADATARPSPPARPA